MAATVQSARGRQQEDEAPPSSTGSRSDGANGVVNSGVGQTSCARKVSRLVRYDVDDNGYCAHHVEIQLLKRCTDDGDWAIVRKKCPECIKEDCPAMLGGDIPTPNNPLAEQRASSLAIDVSDLLEEADSDGLDILLRRPDRISISYLSPRRDDVVVNCRSRILSGLRFSDSSTGAIVIHDIQKQHDSTTNALPEFGCDVTPISQCVNVCALLEGSQHSSTHFDVGDLVEYACGVDCHRGRREALPSATCVDFTDDHDAAVCTTSEAPVDNNVENMKFASNGREIDTDATSYLIRKIQELSSDEFDTTVCVSTKTSREYPSRLSQAIALFSTKDAMMDSSLVTKDNRPNDEVDASFGRNGIDNSCFDIGVVFSQQDNRLIIKSVSKNSNGWFSSTGCAIREGDIVVGINEFITSTMSPEEATALIHGIVSSRTTSQLSITTIAMSQTINPLTKWDIVRKSVVGAVGGTLTASGAILMVTPLHPVGHAMALGGVAVLATEFEAPRKVLIDAKQRLAEERMKWNERRRSRREARSMSIRQESSWSGDNVEDRPAENCTNTM